MAAFQAGPNVGLNYASSGLQNGLPGHSKGAHDKARKSVELQLPANFQPPRRRRKIIKTRLSAQRNRSRTDDISFST